MWVWALWMAAGLAYEFYTLWWNKRRRKAGDPRKANLTAYVQAFFQTHPQRRLKWHLPPWALTAFFAFWWGHFMGWY